MEVLQKPDSADGQPYTVRDKSSKLPGHCSNISGANAWDWCAGKDGASAELQINVTTSESISQGEHKRILALRSAIRGNGYQTKSGLLPRNCRIRPAKSTQP